MIMGTMPMSDTRPSGSCQFSVHMASQPKIMCLYSLMTWIESLLVEDVLCPTETFLKFPANFSKLVTYTPKNRRCFSLVFLCKTHDTNSPTAIPHQPTTLNLLFAITKMSVPPSERHQHTLALVTVFDIKTRPKQKIGRKQRKTILKELKNWSCKELVKW